MRNRVKNLLADLSRRNLIAPERNGTGTRLRLVPLTGAHRVSFAELLATGARVI